MSTASTTRTIKFISKSGTFTALIMSNKGDLYQDYEGTAPNAVTAVYPDFAVTKPILYFVCTSSRAAEALVSMQEMKYYFNGIEITFDSDGISTGQFAGVFKKIVADGTTHTYCGLQILKNIAALSGYAPVVIKMVGTVLSGDTSDSIQASYTIPVTQSSGTAYKVTIAPGDSNNFVITRKGGSCVLKAMVYLGAGEVTQNLAYTWKVLNSGTWKTLQGQTSQTLTVAETDINTYGEYLVEVKLNGNLIGQDIQGVMDASDPYDIEPNPFPADEVITEYDDTRKQVKYSPKVVCRDGSAAVGVPDTFYFVVKSATGVFVNTDRTTAKKDFTVTREMCANNGGDLSITITTAD